MSNTATAMSFVRGTLIAYGSEENPEDYAERSSALEEMLEGNLTSNSEAVAQFGLLLWWETEQDPEVIIKFLCSVDQKLGTKAACVCARWSIERFWTDKTDTRPIDCVNVTERWLRGEATIDEVNAAANAAYYAAYYAAYAAANAANAAYAAYAAANAANAAYAANAARYAAAYAVNAVNAAARLELCKEIRKVIELPSVRLLWK